MPDKPAFERVGSAWVARNPVNLGVVEFYGGAIFERCPTLFYEEYLEGLFSAGYNIVAFTFPSSFDHINVAVGLVDTRCEILAQLGPPFTDPSIPHYWVGHSIGCKIIALLQILLTDSAAANAQQPALLLAPDISGTEAAIPGPLGKLVDWLGLGVKPTELQTKTLIAERSDILVTTGLISFASDTIAGNADGSLPKGGNSSVKWFIDTLSARVSAGSPSFFTHTQLPGSHLAPLGYDFEGRSRAVLAGVKRRAFGRGPEDAGRVGAIVEASLTILETLGRQNPR
jgi:Protein of unknown function (DUF1350)